MSQGDEPLGVKDEINTVELGYNNLDLYDT